METAVAFVVMGFMALLGFMITIIAMNIDQKQSSNYKEKKGKEKDS